MLDQNKKAGIETEISCWDCQYMDTSGIYFPGRCNWFKEVKNQEPKEISADLVDKGCKLFQPSK